MNEVIICTTAKCGTSRNTPVVIRSAGIEPAVIDAEGKRV
jgi:arsenate reductase-like glutaredoxin family protein